MTRRTALGTRLIAAMVLLSVVVLGLLYATTYVLVRRELQENALSNLKSRTAELRPLVRALADGSGGSAGGVVPRLRNLRAQLRAGLRISGLSAVFVSADGAV